MESEKKYILGPGEKFVVRCRIGRSIGVGYLHRRLSSIAVEKSDGTPVYGRLGGGFSPYFLEKSTHVYAEHYKSGLSRRDRESYASEIEELEKLVERANSSGFFA